MAALLFLAMPALGAEPLLVHVHGLSFSADGATIFVPGNTGLAVFRIGSWSEVNGPIHDFAGFPYAEHAIYASGHPPEGSGLPNPLGLVKSIDGGRTWQPLALGGEAYFHRIAAGYRSGAVYVLSAQPNSAMPVPGLHLTRDEGRTWRRASARGLEGEIFEIDAHPRAAGSVALSTYVTSDGGSTWRQIAKDGDLP